MHRFLDLLAHRAVDGLELRLLDHARFQQPAGQDLDAVVVEADIVDLALAAVGLRIALEMTEEADHLAFQQRGSAAFAGPLDDLARRFVDGEEIRAVDRHTRQAEARGAVDIAVHRHGPVAGGGFGIAVVLHHEDHRQIPDGREIEAFQEHALVGGAVTDEADSHPPVAAELGGKRGAAGEGRPGAQDAIGAHHALGEIGDMHGAALAAAGPGGAAVDLGHHLAHIDALGDAMAMAAMGGGDAVALVQMHHDASGRGLLSGIEMDEARDIAAREFDMQPLLEFADRAHGAIGLQQPGLVQGKRIIAHGVLLLIKMPRGPAPRRGSNA